MDEFKHIETHGEGEWVRAHRDLFKTPLETLQLLARYDKNINFYSYQMYQQYNQMNQVTDYMDEDEWGGMSQNQRSNWYAKQGVGKVDQQQQDLSSIRTDMSGDSQTWNRAASQIASTSQNDLFKVNKPAQNPYKNQPGGNPFGTIPTNMSAPGKGDMANPISNMSFKPQGESAHDANMQDVGNNTAASTINAYAQANVVGAGTTLPNDPFKKAEGEAMVSAQTETVKVLTDLVKQKAEAKKVSQDPAQNGTAQQAGKVPKAVPPQATVQNDNTPAPAKPTPQPLTKVKAATSINPTAKGKRSIGESAITNAFVAVQTSQPKKQKANPPQVPKPPPTIPEGLVTRDYTFAPLPGTLGEETASGGRGRTASFAEQGYDRLLEMQREGGAATPQSKIQRFIGQDEI